MRTVRSIAVCLALVGGLLANATPAGADHTWARGHWYHQGPYHFSAPPIIDRNNTIRNGVPVFAEASDYITRSSGGVIKPHLAVLGGNPWDCSPVAWRVVVCVARFGPGKTSVAGDSLFGTFDGQHIQWSVVRINVEYNGGSFSDQLLRTMARHELSHSMGLGHTSSVGSMMRAVIAPTADQYNQHDRDALNVMYLNHWH